MVDGTDRLGRVLDDRVAMALADGQQAVHVAEIAVQVYSDDGPGAGRYCLLDQFRGQTPGVRQDVDEHRCGTQMDDRCGSGDPVGAVVSISSQHVSSSSGSHM